MSTSSERPFEPTGVPGLDEVLGVGLARGALLMIVGPPGSGKTTLAAQIAFGAARAGRRAVIFTALSESTNKLIDHLRTLRFCDEAALGDTVQVLSIQTFLGAGLPAAGDDVVAAVRQMRASLVVLDGYQGVRGVEGTAQAARKFLYDVGGRLNLLGATVVVTHTGTPGDGGLADEATTADALIHLDAALAGVRLRRGLTVVKVRGAAPLSGRHSLTLDAAGVAVYPRLESRVVGAGPAEAEASALASALGTPAAPIERAPFGLPELDELLGGGLTRESRTLLAGRLGTGKTLLALRFALAGTQSGEPTIFIGFRESPAQLVQKANLFALGAELRAALAPGGGLTLLRLMPVELEPDVFAATVLGEIDRAGARRLVIDSIAEVQRAVTSAGDPLRLDDYLAALAEALRARRVTVLVTREVLQTGAAEVDFTDEPLAVFAENVILLRQVPRGDRLRHVLAVLKMGLSAHDHGLREFTISAPDSLRVLSPRETDVGVLDDRDGDLR